MIKQLTNTLVSEQTKGQSTNEVIVHGKNYIVYWNVYGYFITVSRLHGPIDAWVSSGYHALLLREGGA